MKTITVCTLYNSFFVVGITEILLFVISTVWCGILFCNIKWQPRGQTSWLKCLSQ